MSSEAEPPRYLLIGAETPLARTLNEVTRQRLPGCDARPLRATAAFLETGEPGLNGRAFLCGLRHLGPQFDGQTLFPQAEARLAETRDIGTFRLVLAIAPVLELDGGSSASPFAKQVRATSWERLYALSWAELVVDILKALPRRELIVLTPRGAALQSVGLMTRFFGEGVADPRVLLRSALTDAGRAALARMEEAGQMNAVPELFDRMEAKTSASEAEAALGIDPVTFDLLQDRFVEDVARIAAMPGVELI